MRAVILSLLLSSVAFAAGGARESDPCASVCESRKYDCASECEAAKECRQDRGGAFSADFCRRGYEGCVECRRKADLDASAKADECGKCRARKDVISPLKPWDADGAVSDSSPTPTECDEARRDCADTCRFACSNPHDRYCTACQSRHENGCRVEKRCPASKMTNETGPVYASADDKPPKPAPAPKPTPPAKTTCPPGTHEDKTSPHGICVPDDPSP